MEFNNHNRINNWLEVRTFLGNTYIPINKIVYIKAENKSSTIYFENLPSRKTNHLLKWYQKRLSEPIFIRCHHSYIVNCLKIDFFCSNVIIIKGGARIPLSRTKKLQFKHNLDFLHKIQSF
jgi:DNA-binding LytR/AlgR family response regulator